MDNRVFFEKLLELSTPNLGETELPRFRRVRVRVRSLSTMGSQVSVDRTLQDAQVSARPDPITNGFLLIQPRPAAIRMPRMKV